MLFRNTDINTKRNAFFFFGERESGRLWGTVVGAGDGCFYKSPGNYLTHQIMHTHNLDFKGHKDKVFL